MRTDMIPLWLKALIWPAWAEKIRRDQGWSKNHRVMCYLFGCMDGCFDPQEQRNLIAAARLVNQRMRYLA